jgi:hypothetical protein
LATISDGGAAASSQLLYCLTVAAQQYVFVMYTRNTHGSLRKHQSANVASDHRSVRAPELKII